MFDYSNEISVFDIADETTGKDKRSQYVLVRVRGSVKLRFTRVLILKVARRTGSFSYADFKGLARDNCYCFNNNNN